MNKVILLGRLTRDPEVRYTQGNEPMAVARYSLAVDRQGKKDENKQECGFYILRGLWKAWRVRREVSSQGNEDCRMW